MMDSVLKGERPDGVFLWRRERGFARTSPRFHEHEGGRVRGGKNSYVGSRRGTMSKILQQLLVRIEKRDRVNFKKGGSLRIKQNGR